MSWLVDLPRYRLRTKVVLAAILFFGMTGFKTYPLILHVSTHIPANLGDPLLITWILMWDFHALTTNPRSLFHANIFYPVHNTLAFSEHLLGVQPLFGPVYALTGNPLMAYNVVFFLSFVCSGLTMFLLVHYWTQHFWASLLSGVLFAFTPLRFVHMGHLQLLNFYWAPLVLLFLERFLRSKSWKDLAGFSAFYWLQVLSSVYLGWLITIAVALYALYYASCIDRHLLRRSMIPQYATFVVCSLLLLLPIHFPYYQAKQQWGFSRSLDECLFYSADLVLSYVTIPSLMNDLYLPLFRLASQLRSYERTLFPGLVLPFLLLLGIFPRRRLPLPAGLRQMKPIYWLLLITAFILSLGPSLIILDRNLHIPLPYLGLYYLAPGFQVMRVPARFGLMVMLAAGVLAALGFLKACSSLNAYGRQLSLPVCHAVLAIFCLSLFMLELGFKPLALARIQTGDEIPAVYRWLAAEKPGPMIEVPLGRGEDFQYMYFSTYHWLPLVNGSSGFIPPTYGQIVQAFQALPSRQAVESLSAMGVKAMVVHLDRLQRHVAQQWRQAQLTELGLEQVAEFGTDVVYRILPVDSTHVLQGELAVPDQLPPGARMRLGLSLQGKDHRLWASPRPPGRVSAVVQWVELRTGKTIIDRGALELPIVIGAGQALFVGLPVRIPVVPGRYLLELHVPSLDLKTPPQSVELTPTPLPTSLDAPQLLAAAYTAEGIPTSVITTEPVAITIKAINTGKAIWLAQAEGARGAVRLGWRWLKGDQEILPQGGRELLTYDVFPGQGFEFHAKIAPPMEPGEYRLEVGLLSELVTWFADQGVEPVRLAIRVATPSGGDFDRVLATQLKAIGDPPRLAIATDQPRYRPGDRLRVSGDVVNAGSARTIDAYVALVWPDKRVYFGIGNGVLEDLRGSWVPVAKGMGLAQGGRLVALPLLDLPLVNMPSGPYTCYFLLTELNTFDIIAKAQVLFTLEP